jgi:hypothetical protein
MNGVGKKDVNIQGKGEILCQEAMEQALAAKDREQDLARDPAARANLDGARPKAVAKA